MITAPRPAPLWLRFVLVALELFTAGGALHGGWLLIGDPTGTRIGFAPGMLDHTHFASYLVMAAPLAIGLVLESVSALRAAWGRRRRSSPKADRPCIRRFVTRRGSHGTLESRSRLFHCLQL